MRHELGPAQVFLNENGAVVHCGLLRGLEVIFIRRQCSTVNTGPRTAFAGDARVSFVSWLS